MWSGGWVVIVARSFLCMYTHITQPTNPFSPHPKTNHKPPPPKHRAALSKIVHSCIGTKFSSRWGPFMVDLAVESVTKASSVGWVLYVGVWGYWWVNWPLSAGWIRPAGAHYRQSHHTQPNTTN